MAFHVPTVTIPAARGPNGLLVGVQIIGSTGGDLDVLAISAWAMRALGLEVEEPMPEKDKLR